VFVNKYVCRYSLATAVKRSTHVQYNCYVTYLVGYRVLFCCRLCHRICHHIDVSAVCTVYDRLTLAVQELATNKKKVELQNNQISGYEQKIQLLRKQLEGLENEREKDQKKIAELQEALTRAREVKTTLFFNSYGKPRREILQKSRKDSISFFASIKPHILLVNAYCKNALNSIISNHHHHQFIFRNIQKRTIIIMIRERRKATRGAIRLNELVAYIITKSNKPI